MMIKTMTIIAAALALTACGGETSNAPSETTDTPATSDQPAKNETDGAAPDAPVSTGATPPADEPAAAAAQETDADFLKRGQRMFLRCRTCHTVNEGGRHGTGPNLYGIFGAEAASKEGFGYSEAIKNSNIVWTDETIDQYIESPAGLIPGNAMAFVGLRKAEDRAALIAYLKNETR